MQTSRLKHMNLHFGKPMAPKFWHIFFENYYKAKLLLFGGGSIMFIAHILVLLWHFGTPLTDLGDPQVFSAVNITAKSVDKKIE